jgi:hypothetical protein
LTKDRLKTLPRKLDRPLSVGEIDESDERQQSTSSLSAKSVLIKTRSDTEITSRFLDKTVDDCIRELHDGAIPDGDLQRIIDRRFVEPEKWLKRQLKPDERKEILQNHFEHVEKLLGRQLTMTEKKHARCGDFEALDYDQ